MSDTIENAMKIIQLEEALAESQRAVSRAHTMLRNVAVDLEDGTDPLKVADDIHEALGEDRPNGTNEEEDDT